jgi:hypothetical protein
MTALNPEEYLPFAASPPSVSLSLIKAIIVPNPETGGMQLLLNYNFIILSICYMVYFY